MGQFLLLGELVSKIWDWLSHFQFLWRVLRNWFTLSNAVHDIENVFEEIAKQNRKLPNMGETQVLLNAISNILKTEVIQITGLDDFKVAAGLDEISHSLHLSLTDKVGNPIIQSPQIQKQGS